MDDSSVEEDLQKIVKGRLHGIDHCLSAVRAQILQLGNKAPCVLALVSATGEHGLFVYTCTEAKISDVNQLKFENAIPISSDFKFNFVTNAAAAKQSDIVEVRFYTEVHGVNIVFKRCPEASVFFGDLKTAVQVQSQNAAFCTPSFKWMEKYTQANPFENDIFDPFSAKKDNDWADGFLSSSSVGPACPVVTEDGIARTPSLPSFQKLESDSTISYIPGGLTASQDSNIQRSFDSGLNELGELPSNKMAEGRENRIRLIMKQREDEYTNLKSYRIFCGTWNTNGQAASVPIDDWLSPPEDADPPDIYAIGFQELDLSKNAYIFSESPREAEWYQKVKEALHKKGNYRKVKLIRLVGIMLIVFVRDELSVNIQLMAYDTVATGIMGMMGNKGGVGVRFEIDNSSLCFVNCHLAAHSEEFERRNQDFREINSRMNFGGKTITGHDFVFWIGDLNYRLDDIENDDCKRCLHAGKLSHLLQFDQLTRQISLKKVFLDYHEGEINFSPTYKYDTGTDNWDTSEKCRTPAWCDRVLWRGSRLKQVAYRSHKSLKISDHKPVSSIFQVPISVIDKKQYFEVYKDVMKKLDRLENEYLPQVTLDKTELRFEDVRFVEPQCKIVTVKNVGQVPVQFAFIKKPKDVNYCKPWLQVSPDQSIIKKGESLDIQFEVYVKQSTAAALNTEEDKIEDILVLHLDEGRDLFISVFGNYIPSSFGSSLEALVHMFGPIRDVKTSSLIDLEHNSSHTSPIGERPLDVPKEIWRLVDHIYNFGMNQEGLFEQPGMHRELLMIRDCLDTGNPAVIPGSVFSVAEALLLFLESTAQPVIPYNYYNKCLDSCSKFILCKQVLSQIPVSHRNVFKYICAFLRKLLQSSSINGQDSKILAKLFGEHLLRSPASKNQITARKARGDTADKRTLNIEEEKKRAHFVYQFLINEYDD